MRQETKSAEIASVERYEAPVLLDLEEVCANQAYDCITGGGTGLLES